MKIIKDKSPIAYIYCIHNKTLNKRYIGQTNSYVTRSSKHKQELSKKRHYNEELQKDFNKGHELECFIIEKCDNSSKFKRERFWIDYFNTIEEGYNNQIGSKKGMIKQFSSEHIENINLFHKKRKGKHRKTRKIKVTCFSTGAVYEFCNLVEAGKFFGIKGHSLSKKFGKNLAIQYKGYSLKREQNNA